LLCSSELAEQRAAYEVHVGIASDVDARSVIEQREAGGGPICSRDGKGAVHSHRGRGAK